MTIRCGYWPSDARGPKLVFSFETEDEVGMFLQELEGVSRSQTEMKFSEMDCVHLSELNEIILKVADISQTSMHGSNFIVSISRRALDELIDKLRDLKISAVNSHNYVAIDREVDILITKGEYSQVELP